MTPFNQHRPKMLIKQIQTLSFWKLLINQTIIPNRKINYKCVDLIFRYDLSHKNATYIVSIKVSLKIDKKNSFSFTTETENEVLIQTAFFSNFAAFFVLVKEMFIQNFNFEKKTPS